MKKCDYYKVSKIKPEIKWSNLEQVEIDVVTLIGGLNSYMWQDVEMIWG